MCLKLAIDFMTPAAFEMATSSKEAASSEKKVNTNPHFHCHLEVEVINMIKEKDDVLRPQSEKYLYTNSDLLAHGWGLSALCWLHGTNLEGTFHVNEDMSFKYKFFVKQRPKEDPKKNQDQNSEDEKSEDKKSVEGRGNVLLMVLSVIPSLLNLYSFISRRNAKAREAEIFRNLTIRYETGSRGMADVMGPSCSMISSPEEFNAKPEETLDEFIKELRFRFPELQSHTSQGHPSVLSEEGKVFQTAIEAAVKIVIKLHHQLDQMDAICGDGDAGTNLVGAANAIRQEVIEEYPVNDPVDTIRLMGQTIRKEMKGIQATIYQILCLGAYARLKDISSALTAEDWCEAFEASIDSVMRCCGTKSGDRTLLDALIPASKELKKCLAAGEDPMLALLRSSEEAMGGAKATQSMKAKVGRAEESAEETSEIVMDPGAWAAANWYKAAALAVINSKA